MSTDGDLTGVLHRELASCRHIAVEGGGALGIAYLAVLRALEAAGSLPQIRTAAGTSAGAGTAVAIATRAPVEVIEEHIGALTLDGLLPAQTLIGRRWGIGNVVRLVATRGIYDRRGLDTWCASFVRACCGETGVTFAGVLERFGCRLLIPATDIRRAHRGDAVAVFGPESTPGAAVAEAMAASMSLPLVWAPKYMTVPGRGDGLRPLGDGGLQMNHPLGLLAAYPDGEVVGLRLDKEWEVSGEELPELGDSLVAWVSGLVMGLRRAANNAHVDRWHRCIRIVPPAGLGVLSFGAAAADRRALEGAAQAAMIDWARKVASTRGDS